MEFSEATGGLRRLGYIEGQNLRLEYRWSANDEFDELAAELALVRCGYWVVCGAFLRMYAPPRRHIS